MQTVSTYLDSLTSEQLGIMIFGYAARANDRLIDLYAELSKEEFLATESKLLAPNGYRVDNLSDSFVPGQDIQMQVTHVETQQVVMAYTIREGEWVERPQTDPNVQPGADYSGDTVTVHQFDESFKVELVSAFTDISQKAGLVASTYLEAAGEDTIDVELPNGLFFQREYRDDEVWRDLVFSPYDVSSEGNHYAVAQNFSSGAGMGLPMSEQTEQLVLQEFNQQVELYRQEQIESQEQMKYTPEAEALFACRSAFDQFKFNAQAEPNGKVFTFESGDYQFDFHTSLTEPGKEGLVVTDRVNASRLVVIDTALPGYLQLSDFGILPHMAEPLKNAAQWVESRVQQHSFSQTRDDETPTILQEAAKVVYALVDEHGCGNDSLLVGDSIVIAISPLHETIEGDEIGTFQDLGELQAIKYDVQLNQPGKPIAMASMSFTVPVGIEYDLDQLSIVAYSGGVDIDQGTAKQLLQAVKDFSNQLGAEKAANAKSVYNLPQEQQNALQQSLIDRLKAGESLVYTTSTDSKIGVEFSDDAVFVVESKRDESSPEGWRSFDEASYLVDTEVPKGAFIQAFKDFGILEKEFNQQQVQQRESVPQSSVPVEQQPEAPTSPQKEVDSTAQAHSSKPKLKSKGDRLMTTAQAPEVQAPQKQKTAEFKYFELGGARVAGPAANLIAASMKDKGVELKRFQDGGSYVALKANQVAQAMAIAGRSDYQINKVSYKDWAPQAQAQAQAQVPQTPTAPAQPTKQVESVEAVAPPLTPDADLSTVIKGNIFVAAALQQNGDSKVPTLAAMREKDVVTVGKNGGIRIDKGGKDGKGVMILGQSQDGNFYAAHKGVTDVDGKLQAVDPAQNKQPALLYREDAVGNALTNRVAEANQVLPKALDFSNVATAIRQNMPQLKLDIAAESKSKTKAGAGR